MGSSLSNVRKSMPFAHRWGRAEGRERRRAWVAVVLAAALIVPSLFLTGAITSSGAQTISFVSTEVLGTPTDTSVRVNIIPGETVQMFFEYGTTSGVYTNQTPTLTATANQPHEVQITGLAPDTEYFYRTRYIHPNQPGVTEARPEQSFHTARATGEPFVFDVVSDSHLNHLGTPARYQQDSNNIAAEKPDFVIDTGDTFINDNLTTQAAVDQKYLDQRVFFDTYAGSSPVFLSPGNHEEEEGWNLDDNPSPGMFSIKARKKFFPTPTTDSFYSGNTDPLAGIGADIHDSARDNLREDYYSFEWGDALFVVIDEFEYTTVKPYTGAVAGEQNDETQTTDQWGWTLGQQQYDWFNDTLKNSNAKFKFVFSHHMLGGQLAGGGSGGPAGYVRGGAAAADFFEWGGKNANGTDGFAEHRPTFTHGPIQQIMLDSGVTGYYHGHDHQYAYELVDGIHYLSMPAPGMTGSGFNLYTEGANNGETIKVLPNSGHIRVTVDPTQNIATSEYVRSDQSVPANNGVVSHTYTMAANDGGGGNTPPVANNDSASVNQGQATPINVLGNDTDSDGDTLTVSAVTQGSNGATVTNNGTNVTYTSSATHCGADSFTYTANDGNGGTDTATVNVTVGACNQAPTISASPNPVTVTAGQSKVVDLTTGDPDGDPVTTQITSGPGFASLVGGDLQLSPSAGDVSGSPYTVTVRRAMERSTPTSTSRSTWWSRPQGTFGDFDGDGTADFAVFRPASSRWYVNGIAGSTQWGKSGDVAVPGDYNGDGTTDVAVFRPSNGRWYVNGIAGSTQWGKNGDVAVPGDYNGDGTTDFAVYRPSNSRWYVQGIAGSTQWGKSGDVAVPGDYNGDGTTDIAIFRPSNNRWYINGIAGSTQWGKSGDIAAPGDYNGDGTTDIAIFRPSNGNWYINGIAGSTPWGKNGDIPVPADYNGNGTTNIAVYRPSNGTWYVNGIAGSTQWGQNGDLPLTRAPGA